MTTLKSNHVSSIPLLPSKEALKAHSLIKPSRTPLTNPTMFTPQRPPSHTLHTKPRPIKPPLTRQLFYHLFPLFIRCWFGTGTGVDCDAAEEVVEAEGVEGEEGEVGEGVVGGVGEETG